MGFETSGCYEVERNKLIVCPENGFASMEYT
jgi:hypothetical protein